MLANSAEPVLTTANLNDLLIANLIIQPTENVVGAEELNKIQRINAAEILMAEILADGLNGNDFPGYKLEELITHLQNSTVAVVFTLEQFTKIKRAGHEKDIDFGDQVGGTEASSSFMDGNRLVIKLGELPFSVMDKDGIILPEKKAVAGTILALDLMANFQTQLIAPTRGKEPIAKPLPPEMLRFRSA
jgi:hypothetical protein